MVEIYACFSASAQSTLALINVSKSCSKRHSEEIEEVLQKAVDDSMRSLISSLKEKLPTDSQETSQAEIERALFIARFLLSIRTKARSLLLLLSSAQQWEVCITLLAYHRKVLNYRLQKSLCMFIEAKVFSGRKEEQACENPW